MNQVFDKNRPGKLFEQVITSSSHIRAECGFCKREFFQDDEKAGDWEDGELEDLRRRAINEPDKCIAMEKVSTGIILNTRGVIGCPCNWGTQYEQMIWESRRFIMDYLSTRIKSVVEHALQDEAFADQAKTDLDVEGIAVQTVRCPKCMSFVSKLAMPTTDACVHCIRKEEEAKEMVRLAKESALQSLEKERQSLEQEKKLDWERKMEISKDRRKFEEFQDIERRVLKRMTVTGCDRKEAELYVEDEDRENLPF